MYNSKAAKTEPKAKWYKIEKASVRINCIV